jgi:hypothetical protein
VPTYRLAMFNPPLGLTVHPRRAEAIEQAERYCDCKLTWDRVQRALVDATGKPRASLSTSGGPSGPSGPSGKNKMPRKTFRSARMGEFAEAAKAEGENLNAWIEGACDARLRAEG